MADNNSRILRNRWLCDERNERLAKVVFRKRWCRPFIASFENRYVLSERRSVYRLRPKNAQDWRYGVNVTALVCDFAVVAGYSVGRRKCPLFNA
jgi:hypothetical protein